MFRSKFALLDILDSRVLGRAGVGRLLGVDSQGQDRHEDGENGQLRRLDLEDGIWCGDEAEHEGDDNIQLVGTGST